VYPIRCTSGAGAPTRGAPPTGGTHQCTHLESNVLYAHCSALTSKKPSPPWIIAPSIYSLLSFFFTFFFKTGLYPIRLYLKKNEDRPYCSPSDCMTPALRSIFASLFSS
jgi:hypothetical protein